MEKQTFAVLDSNNICETIIIYNQPLNSPPGNYISITKGQDVQWRKYVNGQWSEEKYLPEVEQGPTLEDKINYIYYKNMGVIA